MKPFPDHQLLFKQTKKLVNDLNHTANIILEKMFSDLFSDELMKPFSNDHSSLKIVSYPKLNKTKRIESTRNWQHEDHDLLTLLPISKDMVGLQYYVDNTWIEPEISAGDIIVNSGFALAKRSSSCFSPAKHRVRSPHEDDLDNHPFSMAYFHNEK